MHPREHGPTVTLALSPVLPADKADLPSVFTGRCMGRARNMSLKHKTVEAQDKFYLKGESVFKHLEVI